jgi:hypothetical protein
MDKTSMTLGWLVGRQIAGQRKAQEKEPIAYLYNGVQLPPLPEWDREMYPYAVLTNIVGSYSLELYYDNVLYHKDGVVYFKQDITILRSFLDKDTTQWGDFEERLYSEGDVWIIPMWTNTDILNSDGSVYLAASDPIPVYE